MWPGHEEWLAVKTPNINTFPNPLAVKRLCLRADYVLYLSALPCSSVASAACVLYPSCSSSEAVCLSVSHTELNISTSGSLRQHSGVAGLSKRWRKTAPLHVHIQCYCYLALIMKYWASSVSKSINAPGLQRCDEEAEDWSSVLSLL